MKICKRYDMCVVKPERALKARVHNVIATSQEQASRLE